MFSVNIIVKNSDEEKRVHSCYGIAFNGANSSNFGNDDAKNIIFSVDDSSSSHTDNRKNNFLVLGNSPTYCINGSFGSTEKKFSNNFSKANTKFCLSLHYNIKVICL